MFKRYKWELFLLFCFSVFSWWLMDKSFGYNFNTSQFRIARHQVGDFGLHLSLIRSFSWGNNFPPELPFFPGKPLPYHYYFDFLVGMLEKIGLRIDFAFNGLSILGLTALLFLIYKLSQLIFGKNTMLGLLSVILFITSSSLSFIDFFKDKSLTLNLLRDLWFIPNYLHKGPFDGSLISILFTLNVYLNQRHFIAGLAISLFLVYFILSRILRLKNLEWNKLVLVGIILGISSRFHTLAFLSTVLVLFLLLVLFKRVKWILYIFIPAALIFIFHARAIINQDLHHQFINPGFLAGRPLSIYSFSKFWFLNFGLAVFTIPFGVYLSSKTGKKIFFSVFSLFIIGNIFQLSFRIDHNHSLFNFFFIFANLYSAHFLVKLWSRGMWSKVFSILLIFLLTASGIINLMAIKNDFQLNVKDAPENKFMQWIKTDTNKNTVFLAPAKLYDPITLSGRRNYLGAGYYLEVLGYNPYERQALVKKFFEVDDVESLDKIRKEKIAYMVIPLGELTDFNYMVNTDFLTENLKIAYQDKDVLVFKL